MPNDRTSAALASDFAAVARIAAAGGLRTSTSTTLPHLGQEQLVVLSGAMTATAGRHRATLERRRAG